MEIRVKKNDNGNLCACNNNGISLFDFAYRDLIGGWCFWLKDNYNPTIKKGKEFPMKFFLDACRTMDFLIFQNFLDIDAEIVEGLELLRV